ncbi:MAG: phenylacetate--CoA ligase, partial [Rhodocyclaceae bacterium]|nr:phenylacetate--CoA ligase [Rhodocyclaceae bacterium]
MSEVFEAVESAGRPELAALQLQRLKATLSHAWRNVAPLRRRFERAGVQPGDLRSLADLARFPFTTKADLRDAYPFGLFA